MRIVMQSINSHEYKFFVIVLMIWLQCETLIEEHEETLIEAFQETVDSPEDYLCVGIIG